MDANPLQNTTENQDATSSEIREKPSGNSATKVEVKMLREQMDEIRSLERARVVRISGSDRGAMGAGTTPIALTDQRERDPKRDLWSRLAVSTLMNHPSFCSEYKLLIFD